MANEEFNADEDDECFPNHEEVERAADARSGHDDDGICSPPPP